MIGYVALIVVAQAPQGNQAAQLVSQMLAYYNNAKTLTGTIQMTQTAGSRQATVSTVIQAEWPSKLYLRQELKAAFGSDSWLVTSDGMVFSYDPPSELEGKRLAEPVDHATGSHDIRSIYAATVKSIYDRSTPLDIVIGRMEDLRYRNYQWVNVVVQGEAQIGEDKVTVVGGQWREYGQAPASGTYTMAIDGQKRLRQFTLKESLEVGNEVLIVKGQRPRNPTIQQITTVWDVNVIKDGPVKPELFKVVY